MGDYKVCIPVAGIGSRMLEFTQSFNKALIPIQGKPAICHIIEKFPEDIEIVLAVGYMKEGIINYLKHAYPNRKLTFVDVGKYEGPGTGPGFSIYQCKDYLQYPFVFFAGDTLVREEIPLPNSNWFGLASVKEPKRFCTAKVEDGKIARIDDKTKTDNKYAFIGLAGIKDYECFWQKLGENKTLIGGEIQVSNGFTALMEKGMLAKFFTWFDTGTPQAYEYTLKNYPCGNSYIGE